MTAGPDLGKNLETVRAAITAASLAAGRQGAAIELLAVSKMHPSSAIRAAYAAGQRGFGENRVQELAQKARELADLTELRWHLIGSLQTNKVQDLLRVPGLALVHSLDRARLADQLQKELARAQRSLAVLLQINATGEEQKHGVEPAQAAGLLQHVQEQCPALQVRGVMAMGPLTGDPTKVFEVVAALRRELEQASGLTLPVLSLGMTNDLDAAIAAGSTLVRIGTAVFGERD